MFPYELLSALVFCHLAVPLEASSSTGFGIALESGPHFTGTEVAGHVHIDIGTAQRHTDVAVMVEYSFPGITPFRRGSSGPCA